MSAPTAVDALLQSPEVVGMIEAVAHRVGIYNGVGYLDADDVKAELMAVAADCAGRFDPQRHSKFTTLLWPRLYGCAVDLRRRHGRRSRRGKQRPIEVALDSVTISATVSDSTEARLDLEGALACLPASERAVILMRDYGGMLAEDIAGLIGYEPADARLDRRLGLRRLRVGLPAR
jgi:RNA polymerase sigma factor (sigma-70 family)